MDWVSFTSLLVVLCSAAKASTIPTDGNVLAFTTPPVVVTEGKWIRSFHVKSDIRFRFATTQIDSVVKNIADKPQEIEFGVTLPKEAFIVKFSMEIDGKVYDGEVKEKMQAKREYQEAVNRGESAGHVKQAPRHANVFDVSVNVANGSEVNFKLTYQEMLRRKFGVYNHEIHINPGQAVDDFLIEVNILENKPLKYVRTPALKTESLITNEVGGENTLTTIDQQTAESAHILYRPPISEQGTKGMSARFAVEYDVEHSMEGEILAVDGYFVHFFSPDLQRMPKDIIFVLDVSGSMSGKKMSQLQTAMLTILEDLRPDDRFNIITFSSEVSKWKTGLMPASEDVVKQAKGFVKETHAQGSTDINSALLEALSVIQSQGTEQRAAMIFFLTDGVPTTGEEDADNIAKNVMYLNKKFAAIYTLAFGDDADYSSLKVISAQNSGFARKIYEASDAALQVESFYQEISTIILKNLNINYLSDAVDEFTITETNFPVVFNGSEIVICGLLSEGVQHFKAEINGLQKSGFVDLVFETDIDNVIIDKESSDPLFTAPRDFAGIIEKMWAYMTIKQLLREKEQHALDVVKVAELKEKIMEMSLKYQFVTPLTSMVVTKPDNKDQLIISDLQDIDTKTKTAVAMPSHKGTSFQYYVSGVAGALGPPSGVMDIVPSYLYSGLHPPTMGSFYGQTGGVATYDNVFRRGGTKLKNKKIMRMTRRPTTTTAATTTTTTAGKVKATPIENVVYTTVPKGIKLSSIDIYADNVSMCVAPKKLDEGKYIVISSDHGNTQLIAEFDCHSCFAPKVNGLMLQSANTIHVTGKGNSIIKGSADYRTVELKDTVTFIIPGLEVTIYVGRHPRSQKRVLKVKIQLSESKDKYGGFASRALNFSEKRLRKIQSRRRSPPGCQGEYNMFLKQRDAAKYIVTY